MLAKETADFLKKLKKDNDREWFNTHKADYLRASDNIVAITGELIGRVAKFDPSVASLDPRSCVFRIYRDVRFSKDKSPYKTNLGAFISPGGRKSAVPGFYFHVEPGVYFAAAGKHMPSPIELLKIRKYISENPSEFLKLVRSRQFLERFGELDGERLSRPPKGFSPDDPTMEHLKLKSFTVTERFSDTEALSKEYPKLLAESFKSALSLVTFLRKALG